MDTVLTCIAATITHHARVSWLPIHEVSIMCHSSPVGDCLSVRPKINAFKLHILTKFLLLNLSAVVGTEVASGEIKHCSTKESSSYQDIADRLPAILTHYQLEWSSTIEVIVMIMYDPQGKITIHCIVFNLLYSPPTTGDQPCNTFSSLWP